MATGCGLGVVAGVVFFVFFVVFFLLLLRCRSNGGGESWEVYVRKSVKQTGIRNTARSRTFLGIQNFAFYGVSWVGVGVKCDLTRRSFCRGVKQREENSSLLSSTTFCKNVMSKNVKIEMFKRKFRP
uniref:Uncharacterized protein n=1 Tax=Octopus bimaculoides TaxID=37653 RepID=A0A0L8I7D6_OCTBM